MEQQPSSWTRPLTLEATRSVKLLWTSDQPTLRPLHDNTQQSQETDIHEIGGTRTPNPGIPSGRRY
jgi:hypothetical protein